MQKCKLCGFPDTRPGLIFEEGICLACINFSKRKKIDWEERERELSIICDKYRGSKPYDCLIPVSGGKDSHTLVNVMEENGMHPILFNVADWFTQTKAGKHNLDNLCQKHDLVIRKMSRDCFLKATRGAFEATGEALKLIEYFIYLWPIQYAQEKGIPLVIFGEDSNFQYGTSMVEKMEANNQIESMIEKVRSELDWWDSIGVAKNEIKRALPEIPIENPKVLWLSYFKPWSSLDNLKVARNMGFWTLSDTQEWDRQGVFPGDDFEQVDSLGYLVHLWLKHPKFSFQRVTDIGTRRLREGRITREQCDRAIAENDHKIDTKGLKDFCQTLGYSQDQFWAIANKFKKEIK